jgi:hypothetical protein
MADIPKVLNKSSRKLLFPAPGVPAPVQETQNRSSRVYGLPEVPAEILYDLSVNNAEINTLACTPASFFMSFGVCTVGLTPLGPSALFLAHHEDPYGGGYTNINFGWTSAGNSSWGIWEASSGIIKLDDGRLMIGVLDSINYGWGGIMVEGGSLVYIEPGPSQWYSSNTDWHITRLGNGDYFCNQMFYDEDGVFRPDVGFTLYPILIFTDASYGERHGYVQGVSDRDVIRLSGNNADQYLVHETLPTTLNQGSYGRPTIIKSVLFATYEEVGYAWNLEQNRLIRSDNRIGILYPRKRGIDAYAQDCLTIYDLDLNVVQEPIRVDPTYDSIFTQAYRALPDGGYGVLYTTDDYPNYPDYPPYTYYAKIALFTREGVRGDVIELAMPFELGEDWYRYPTERMQDFAFSDDMQFLVVIKNNISLPYDPVPYYAAPANLLVVDLWRKIDGVWTKIQTIPVDDPGPPEACYDMDLQARVLNEGNNQFAFIYQKFVSNVVDLYDVFPKDLFIRRMRLETCQEPE